VGANKNSIKIIGGETDNWAQGYFVYDSKKSGGVTVSHLRFGKNPIRSIYLVNKAKFIACHQWVFLEKYDMLDAAVEGATFLLNSPYGRDEVWDKLPREVQKAIIAKKLRFYVIDAFEVARKTGMGGRINSIMQTCFFGISNILPREEAIAAIKGAIKKTYGLKGDQVVKMNWDAVDQTMAHLQEVAVPDKATSRIKKPPIVSEDAPEFVKIVTGKITEMKGDELPVSVFPPDGTFPTATTQWEKRNIALEIPVWESDLCIQCGKCSLGLPPRRHPLQGVRSQAPRRRPQDLQVHGLEGRRVPGVEIHPPDGPRGLHRLRHLRGGLSRQEQGGGQEAGHQHGAPDAPSGPRARELQVLPRPPRRWTAPR